MWVWWQCGSLCYDSVSVTSVTIASTLNRDNNNNLALFNNTPPLPPPHTQVADMGRNRPRPSPPLAPPPPTLPEATAAVQSAQNEETEAFRMVEELVERRAGLLAEAEVALGKARAAGAAAEVAGQMGEWLGAVSTRREALAGELSARAALAQQGLATAVEAAERAGREAGALAAAAGVAADAAACAALPWGDLDAWRSAAAELPEEGPRMGASRLRVLELSAAAEGTARRAWGDKRGWRHAGSDDEDEDEGDSNGVRGVGWRVVADCDWTALMEVGFAWGDNASWGEGSRFHPEVTD